MRTLKKIKLDDPIIFKKKLFEWNRQFYTTVWLDSNNHKSSYSNFDVCVASEEFTSIKTDFNGAFEKLKEYQSFTKDYIFGYIAYDVKNDLEKLSSDNTDHLYFDDLFFFQPQRLIFVKGDFVEFHYLRMIDDQIDKDFSDILNLTILEVEQSDVKKREINNRITKDTYLKDINKVLAHIQRGDIYEVNYCQEFYIDNITINPYKIYKDLNEISNAPFATFMRIDDQYLLSASPERYIKKDEDTVISQPIKGTAKRFLDFDKDKASADELANNEKERAENVMIVDLVRNDLSKTAKKGSVVVSELCKVYSFDQVHQMISTVTSKVEDTTHPVDIIRDTFPMGSMTGAPKVSAMKIIERLEHAKRGLYSGAVGYFTPNNDFDFNVIIRSILYNKINNYVSYSVGGAITAKSNPEKEYEECLLKANAMKTVLLR